jgi:hypothetical protein
MESENMSNRAGATLVPAFVPAEHRIEFQRGGYEHTQGELGRAAVIAQLLSRLMEKKQLTR